jgi:pimeloyl-ACP methyl ester carboxylesterase
VVLIHAGIADRTMWREHLEPLAVAGYRAIAVDLPGFGEARVASGEQAPWNDVLDTMAELRLDSAALVGNSFGGAVALRVAVVAPVAVSRLALISAPPVDLDEPSPELMAVWETEEAALARGDVEAAVRAIVDAWVLPDAPEGLRHRVAEMQRRAFALQAEATQVAEAPDPLERDPDSLTRLEVPALVAAGEREPFSDFLDGAQKLARALPLGRQETIPGAGHLAPLETPEAFRDLLLDFLQGV